jgi:hypothetical protein
MSERSITDYTLTNYLADGEDEPVYFGILWESTDELRMAGVRQSVHGRTRHVAGSDINHTYFGGKGPANWEYRVWLQNRTDYELLEAMKQTFGILTVPANIAPLPGDELEREGIIYRILPNVALMDMDSPFIEMPGSVEVVTYWQRNTRSGE